MSLASKAADRTINAYTARCETIRQRHQGLADDLVKEIVAAQKHDKDLYLDFEDGMWDIIGDFKSRLGADAANDLEKTADQEVAIYLCEKWIADNVSNAGFDAWVSMMMWAYGPDEGAACARRMLKGE